jgi:uncharacterized protein (TIGR02302 family)
LRTGAFLALVWEALLPAAWPLMGVLAVWASLALLGIPAWLPASLYLALAIAGAGFLAYLALAAVRRIAWPGAHAAERRLERDSGLRHRPFATLRDTPAGGGTADSALWQLHQARARAAITRLRLRAPDAQLVVHDPMALRAAAFLLLVASLVVAGPQAGSRLHDALVPGWPALANPTPPVIQAWIQPPAYTGQAPVFLQAGGGDVTVPAGSRLTISITGAGFRPHVSLDDAKLPVEGLAQDSFQTTAVLDHAARLSVGARFSRLGLWTINLLPNEPPTARWSKLPGRAGTSLSTSLPWQAQQRWGVAALQADLRPKGRDDLPALKIPLPLPGTPRSATGEAKPDLSANPYAGLTMTGRLEVRDVSGQKGEGAPADFVLPARTFHHPLARAIADLRRRLALHPDQTGETADELSALAEAPVTPPVAGLSAAGTTVNLAATAAVLGDHPTPAGVDQVQARLWTLALALDGALPDAAAAALDEARENLRRSLEDRAHGKLSDRELHQKLDALRQALNKRMDEIARQAMKQGALQHFDPNTQHLSSRAIDRAMQKLERALQEGRMDDARQAMAQLNRMMDALKNAHVISPQEAQQQQEQAKRGRQQTSAVQDMVQRETGLLDHAQARAPHLQDGLPPIVHQDGVPPLVHQDGVPPLVHQDGVPPMPGAQIGRQDLQPPGFAQPNFATPNDAPPTGTEDPSQAPEPFPPLMGPQPGPQADAGDPGEASLPAPAPDAQSPATPSQSTDARTQRALHRALDALKQGVAQSGHKPPAALDDASRAMMDAAGALSHQDDPTARDAIARAIAALQQGGQAMSREQQGQGGSGAMELSLQPGSQDGQGQGDGDGEDSFGDGQSGTHKDPFGRKVDGNGTMADDPNLLVPDQMEQGRSRAIQEELRRRGADRARPKRELDYIDRLLKPF